MHQLSRTHLLKDEKQSIFAMNALSFTYPQGPLVLRSVDLTVTQGDRLAIVGPNGSGKSTLAMHLNGLLSASMGNLFYKGQPLTGRPLEQARFEIGLLFQDPDDHLFCNTLFEDIAFGPMNKGLSKKTVEQIVDVQLKEVGLLDYRDKAAHCLSYGQKKRAALAAIMAMEPETLVLDEPTANLDPKQVEIIITLLNNFQGTLVCISHDLFFLQEICTRALVLEKGKVHHDFSMNELMEAPSALRVHGLDYSFRYSCCRNKQNTRDHVHHAKKFKMSDAAGHDHKKTDDREAPPCPAQKEPVIELRDFSFTYPDGSKGVDAINLEIDNGECIALIGENGAGKSTLALCLTGILGGRGTYLFNANEVAKRNKKDLWNDIGIIFQDSADQLFCSTCWDEVAFGLRQKKLPKEEVEQRVREALTMVNLEGYELRSPLDMSGGERKRLAIAATICLQPQVLIMDEPTAGLDPQGEELLLGILGKLKMTVILITHDLFFITSLSQRTVVMHQGEIIRNYSTQEFVNDHHLQSINQLDYTYNNECCQQIQALHSQCQ